MLLILVFSLLGCYSKASELIWDPSSATYNVTAKAYDVGEIEVVIPKNEHLNARTSAAAGTYFVGYYVYRNAEGPYSKFNLQGIDSYPSDTVINYQQRSSSGNVADATMGIYRDSACTPNKIYYYRVITMYQYWNGTAFNSELQEKGKSSWSAAICPSVLVFSP